MLAEVNSSLVLSLFVPVIHYFFHSVRNSSTQKIQNESGIIRTVLICFTVGVRINPALYLGQQFSYNYRYKTQILQDCFNILFEIAQIEIDFAVSVGHCYDFHRHFSRSLTNSNGNPWEHRQASD